MTLGGLGILILIIGFVWTNIVSIRDLYNEDVPHPVPGTIAIMGWLLIIIFGISYGLMNIDWNYKLF